MPRIAIADSFLDALSDLDPSDIKRTAAFLDKLVHAPAATSLRPEIVHDAADRAVRSFKVTHDLRAIARIEGPEVTLVYVARHDRAYVWVRNACTECGEEVGELVVREQGLLHVCSTTGELCALFTERGLVHGLEP